MPSQHKLLIALRGTDEYAEALDRLARRLIKGGVPIGSRHELGEYAIAELARSLKIKLPRRVPPQGTNRHGEPRDEG